MAFVEVPWKRRSWNVAYWLTAVCFAFFLLEAQDPARFRAAFEFEPHAALHGLELWRFITYAFFFGSPLSFIFSVLMYWILGSALEAIWGSVQFLIFLVVSILGSSTMSAILGASAAGPGGMYFNLLILYAIHFPDAVFFIMFIIPVRVRWIAAITALGVFATSVAEGKIAMMLGTASGLIYWAVRLRSGRIVRAARTGVRRAQALIPKKDPKAEARATLLLAQELAARRASSPSGADDPEVEELKSKITSAVNVCPPEYFDGASEHCLSCNGFVECVLRAAGLHVLPARKPGGMTASSAAGAQALYESRERERARARRSASARPLPEGG